jgi:hypothetical protein
MFRASSCPSSGGTTTAVAASGLQSDLGGSSVVGRGRAGLMMGMRMLYLNESNKLEKLPHLVG